MKKVSIITLSLVMLMNSGVVFSAPKKTNKKRNAINTNVGVNTTSAMTVNTTALEELQEQNVMEELERDRIEGQAAMARKTLQERRYNVKNSCSGIKDDLKAIQVLAGVSTGASAVGTLTSGGALVTGIMKAKTDKKLNELSNMSSLELYEYAKNLEEEKSKLEKKSKTLGNVRTGLMAGSIATSATSTITSGISTKKLDNLIDKMKDCDTAAKQIKSYISQIQSEIDDADDLKNYPLFEKAENIVKSCSGFDTANIKEIKSVMTASTVVGGIGAATSIAGTITSAMANSKDVRNDDSEAGVKKEKGLNIASNVMAGISTGTSAGGIVLGAITLNKLAKNVDVAEKCEDALK
ncbi:hypothetical protein HDR59_03265 [bacterium]|nr:hypothetical protein [bacterium]